MSVGSWLKAPSLFAFYHVLRRAVRSAVYSLTGGKFPALAPPQIGQATDAGFAIAKHAEEQTGFEQIANEGRYVVKGLAAYRTSDGGIITRTVYWSSLTVESFATIMEQLFESAKVMKKEGQSPKTNELKQAELFSVKAVGAWQE